MKKLMYGVKNKNTPHKKDTKRRTTFNEKSVKNAQPERSENLRKKRTVDPSQDSFGFELLSGSGINSVDDKKRKTGEPNSLEDKDNLNESALHEKYRKANRIFVWGQDIPDLWHQNFSERIEIIEPIKSNLEKHDFELPTPVQMQAIPLLLQKRNILVSAPTGSGKTLAFTLPIFLMAIKKYANHNNKPRKIRFVVLSPTKELAKQTYDVFQLLCKDIEFLTVALTGYNDPEAPDILISTPNALSFAIKCGRISLKRVLYLILDESDKLFENLQEGEKSFREQIGKIYISCGPSAKLALFSATFSYSVEEWCKEKFPDLATLCIGPRNIAADTILQRLIYVGSEWSKIPTLEQFLKTNEIKIPCLVFLQSKIRARQLFEGLKSLYGYGNQKLQVGLLDSELSLEERNSALNRFKSGAHHILICTDLAGRGLDIVNVETVINFDLPTSIVAYIHRIGRTGRAGRQGLALTFFTDSDRRTIRPFANLVKQGGGDVPDYLLEIQPPKRYTHFKFLEV